MSNIPDAYRIYKLDEVEEEETNIEIDPYDGSIYMKG